MKVRLLTTLLGLFIGAFTYWTVPYSEMSMLDLKFWAIIGVGSIICALVSTVFFHQKPLDTGLFITLGVVLSVLFRIIYDTIFWDPSSHNLAGIELLIALLQSLPPALIGAYAATIFHKNSNGIQNR